MARRYRYHPVEFNDLLHEPKTYNALVRVRGILRDDPLCIDANRLLLYVGPDSYAGRLMHDAAYFQKSVADEQKQRGVPVYGYVLDGLCDVLRSLREAGDDTLTLSGRYLFAWKKLHPALRPSKVGCLYLHSIDTDNGIIGGFARDEEFFESFKPAKPEDPAKRLMVVLPDIDLDTSVYLPPPCEPQ